MTLWFFKRFIILLLFQFLQNLRFHYCLISNQCLLFQPKKKSDQSENQLGNFFQRSEKEESWLSLKLIGSILYALGVVSSSEFMVLSAYRSQQQLFYFSGMHMFSLDPLPIYSYHPWGISNGLNYLSPHGWPSLQIP